MTVDIDNIQALLAGMRNDFLSELPERCNEIEDQILALEQVPDSTEIFNTLFRGIHSLKGAGGTHGLSIITSICHQIESMLAMQKDDNVFDSVFTATILKYVDLIRRVENLSINGQDNLGDIEVEIGKLLKSTKTGEKRVLFVEPSQVMQRLYIHVTGTLHITPSVSDNGLDALSRLLHEPFDFVVVGGELKELNSLAMVTALRESRSQNQNIPVILISSNKLSKNNKQLFYSIIERDHDLASRLSSELKKLIS